MAILVTLTGCGPFLDQWNAFDHADQTVGLLGRGTVASQSFVAHCNGLSAIDVRVAIYPSVPRSSGSLSLRLTRGRTASNTGTLPADQSTLPSNGSTSPIVVDQFPESSLQPNEWIRLAFSPIAHSEGQKYILSAYTNDRGPSPASLWATGHAVDLPGHRYLNDRPVDGRFVYRAYCDETVMTVTRDVLTTISRGQWLWPVELLLILVPGLAVASFIDQDEQDIGSWLGLAVGWSVLLAPLALAVATPLRFGPTMGLPLLAVGLIALIRRRPRLRFTIPSVLGLAATAVALGIRAVDAKGLAVPLWGDAMQHSYVTLQILRAGGVPSTYGFEMPHEVYDYHFGFQSLAAYGSWLTGASVSDAVLATGQILDAIICLAIYRFGRDLTGSALSGAIGAVLVGMVTTMPSYYVTWGRYTELAGLVALPAAYAALRPVISGRATKRDWIFGILAAGASVLVHPRIAVFLACLVVSFTLIGESKGPRLAEMAARVTRLILIGTASVVLIAPWALRLWNAHHQTIVGTYAWQPLRFPWDLATGGDDRWALLGAAIALFVAAIINRRLAFLVITWCGLLIVLANPATFHLPFAVYLNDDSLAIALFFLAAPLCGWLIDEIRRRVMGAHQANRFVQWSFAGLVFVAGLTQAPHLVTVVNPCCVLVEPADVGAFAWIRTHTPPNARFIIGTNPWAPNVSIGSDAGYWLPVLSERWTDLPPFFYATAPPDQVNAVNQRVQRARDLANHPAALAEFARSIHAQYVFVGVRGSEFDPRRLVESGRFRTVYRDGAWVLEVVDGGGAEARTNSTETGKTPLDRSPPRA